MFKVCGFCKNNNKNDDDNNNDNNNNNRVGPGTGKFGGPHHRRLQGDHVPAQAIIRWWLCKTN